MNKLKGECSLVIIQEFHCTNTRDYINIPSCSEKVCLQEGIFVYSLLKLYNKAIMTCSNQEFTKHIRFLNVFFKYII